MDGQIRQALARDRTIDITTTGRSSGLPRRTEIWFHGTPGTRDWYANLQANPNFTFYLKQSVVAELPARATPVTDPNARWEVFQRILDKLGRPDELQTWLAGSPLVAVSLEGA